MSGEQRGAARMPKPRRPADLKMPGLLFRQRGNRWVLLWSPHSDVVKKGYPKTTYRLWPPSGVDPAQPEPNRGEWEAISAACERYQAEVLLWANGDAKRDPKSFYDGTIRSLINIYQTDEDSPYKNLRHAAVSTYTTHLHALDQTVGAIRIAGLTFRDFNRWYKEFGAPNSEGDDEHLARAHQMIAMLRRLFRFAKHVLVDPEIPRICDILADMEFASGERSREEFMTYQHCISICAAALKSTPIHGSFMSIALAQALMFDCGLRQKDVIGEWMSQHDPGLSDVVRGKWKWLFGARWEEINENLVWTHRLSKSVRGKENILRPKAGKTEMFDLRAYPLVMEHLRQITATDFVQRGQFPVNGPVIVCELTDAPWTQRNWRRWWRIIAREAGVPDTIQNRDSRPGAATEADVAGVERERVRRTLGHSHEETTAGYQRDTMEIRSQIARLRTEKRR